MKQKHKDIILVAFGILLAGILIFYYVDTNKELRLMYDSLEDAVSDYKSKVKELNTSLNEQNVFFTNMISNLREESKQSEKRLEDLIEKVESQSSIQLSEIKSELKDINIKSKDFSAIIDDVLESVVSIMTDKGQGSGAFVADDGYIVTNYHVVAGASIIRILTYGNDIHNAGVIGYSESKDIAVLKINKDYAHLDFGNSDDVKIGEKVIALGNPGGLDFTVTEGIVSAKRKSSSGIDFIQTDVPINPGNSGGPLVDIHSKIIGINEFKVRDFEGLGFAIASNVVSDAVDEIISKYQEQSIK